MKKLIIILALLSSIVLSGCGDKISDTAIKSNVSNDFYSFVMCDLANVCDDTIGR